MVYFIINIFLINILTSVSRGNVLDGPFIRNMYLISPHTTYVFAHARPKSELLHSHPVSKCQAQGYVATPSKSSPIAKQVEHDRTEKLCFPQGNHLVQ